MKTPCPASTAALALAALWRRDSSTMEQRLQYLTSPNLVALDSELLQEQKTILSQNDDERIMISNTDRNCVLAQAMVRRMVHKCLDKYNRIHPSQEIEDALRYHNLPESMQQELAQRYGGSPPETWYQALERLKELSTSGDDSSNMDKSKLWRLILDHPMTSYIPAQCQSCGQHVVSDVSATCEEDAAAGLSMGQPDGSELGLRGGWFRGRPHSANTVFSIACTNCSHVSRWYRSGHPQVNLNPHRWGRLCGEQEELRLNLAFYLHIPIRTCIPLDWDHVWSEFLPNASTSTSTFTSAATTTSWEVHDDNARNFAPRLDEGIGAWAAILAVSPDPAWCCDVTEEYLSCQQSSVAGRADDSHAPNMKRYRQVVRAARTDSSGTTTQAKTCNGYVLHRANWTPQDITKEMKRAAQDYGTCPWWQVENSSS
jgi:hypothetical protein